MQFLVTFALGAVVALSIGDNKKPTTDESINFWLNQAKASFKWNVTSVLQWNAVNTFVGVAVSPLGDLYGIQNYNDGRTNVQYAYKFDFNSGQWNIFDSLNQVQALRFDRMGNVFTIDRNSQITSSNNKYGPKILSYVSDFEITVKGQIYAVANNTNISANAYTPNVFDSTGVAPYTYKMLPNNVYSGVALVNEVPVYQLANGSLIGYGSQCVRSFSFGVDNALWAISCTPDNNASTNTSNPGNFLIVKWDPFLQQWYVVQGQTGVQISAYNEVSAAVLTAQGLISVSSSVRDPVAATYTNRTAIYNSMFNDSAVLNLEGSQWLKNQLLSFGSANLAWRASRDGYKASQFHAKVDGQGPWVAIIKAQTGQIFGGYQSTNYTSTTGWTTDSQAFLFQVNQKIKLPIVSAGNGQYYYGDRFFYFGDTDLIVMDLANVTANAASTQLGVSYMPPPNIAGNSAASHVFLHQSANKYFTPVEIEVYILGSVSQGAL